MAGRFFKQGMDASTSGLKSKKEKTDRINRINKIETSGFLL
jgi:hypothetical protein